jgi:16S rRNA (cytosine967-C5)-methyltransferase
MSKSANKQPHSARLVASRAIQNISSRGENLDKALSTAEIARLEDSRDSAFARSLTYGTLRWYHQLAAILDALLDKPLAAKHVDIRSLLLVALYQLAHTDIAPHAVVSESVNAVNSLRKSWARGLVNAVLRNYQRRRDDIKASLQNNPVAQTSHPQWLLDLLRNAWPNDWQAITRENNRQPPMSLRINIQQQTRDAYLQELESIGISASESTDCPTGLILDKPLHVDSLPGFMEGCVSVQDIAPQLAASLLDAEPGMKILDACAAPGGKSAHLLEHTSGNIELTSLEIDEKRAQRIEDTLHRLTLQADVLVGDATRPDQWWDGKLYDRILLDAPCSGTGVIRRHPDIKLLRRHEDIKASAALQTRLLESLWPLLKPGGLLLYATCSVLPQENSLLVSEFLTSQDDAQEHKIHVKCGHRCDTGIQIFPGTNNMDGFFYACLLKI